MGDLESTLLLESAGICVKKDCLRIAKQSLAATECLQCYRLEAFESKYPVEY